MHSRVNFNLKWRTLEDKELFWIENHKLCLNRSQTSGGKWSCSHLKTTSPSDCLQKAGRVPVPPAQTDLQETIHWTTRWQQGNTSKGVFPVAEAAKMQVSAVSVCLCNKGHRHTLAGAAGRMGLLSLSRRQRLLLYRTLLCSLASSLVFMPCYWHWGWAVLLWESWGIPPPFCRSALEEWLLKYLHLPGN